MRVSRRVTVGYFIISKIQSFVGFLFQSRVLVWVVSVDVGVRREVIVVLLNIILTVWTLPDHPGCQPCVVIQQVVVLSLLTSEICWPHSTSFPMPWAVELQ